MAELKVSEDKRILTELKLELVNLGNQGLKCCVLVADYLECWPHKTDRKMMIAELAKELDLGESRIYQMWKAGEVSKLLSTNVETRESHLRPLAPLVKRGKGIVQDAWKRAQEMAECEDEPLTAAIVQEAVDEFRTLAAVTAPVWTPEGPLLVCYHKLMYIIERMPDSPKREAVNRAVSELQFILKDD